MNQNLLWIGILVFVLVLAFGLFIYFKNYKQKNTSAMSQIGNMVGGLRG
jgi:hypothetical protein